MKEYLTKELGKPIRLHVLTNYAAMIEAVRAKNIDLAYFGPLSYCLARSKCDIDCFAAKSKDAGQAIADKSKEAGHAVAGAAKSVGQDVQDGVQKVKTAVSGKSADEASSNK